MRNSVGRATTARRNIVGGDWMKLGKIIFLVFIFDRSESKDPDRASPSGL
jgi:hypothetical protein